MSKLHVVVAPILVAVLAAGCALAPVPPEEEKGEAPRPSRVFQVPGSSAMIRVWSERSTGGRDVPHYEITDDGRVLTKRATSYDLKLRNARFDPLSGPDPGHLELGEAESTSKVYILQFWTQSLPGYLGELEAAGAEVLAFLPEHARIVRMTPEARRRVESMPFVRWVGPYRWLYRLDRPLCDAALAKHDLPEARYNIQLFERGPGPQEALSRFIERNGGKVHARVKEGFRLEATLSFELLVRVANRDEVLFADPWAAPEADDPMAREIGGADYLERVAGFTGLGVSAEVMDSGLLATHQEFAGTILAHGPFGVSAHGTSTAGINFAKGVDDPLARGMVPDAQGIFAAYGSLNAAHSRYEHTAELLGTPYFAVYQSNSWGSGLTTQYTTLSAEMDDIIYLNDFVILQSQSNTGTQSSRPQAWAKNVVSVGGIRHCTPLCSNDQSTHTWTRGASIGPAEDGRIKPDLANFYDKVYAPTSTSNTAYTTGFGGTSAATPITAGHFGLFFQMWHEGVFGNPTAASVFDSRPHAATAKAIMINTARQWPFSGAAHDRTRVHQGWGLADVANLYDQRDQLLIVDEADPLTAFQSTTYRVTPSGLAPLKVTMVYRDPMGTTSAALHRINDLDLTVISPLGDVFHGNEGLLEEMWSAAGGAPDTLNTVENVFVELPDPGTWTVTVTATELNVGDTAPYALVVSGISP